MVVAYKSEAPVGCGAIKPYNENTVEVKRMYILPEVRGKNLTAALSGITAAVIGVILNLVIWFSINTLFQQTDDAEGYGFSVIVPVWNTLEIGAFIIALIAFLVYFWWELDMLKTILICMLLGLVYTFVGKVAGSVLF